MSTPFPTIPYGRASFEAIRREGCLHVGKTAHSSNAPQVRGRGEVILKGLVRANLCKLKVIAAISANHRGPATD